MYRGSKKHVLDWTSRPEFVVEVLQLIAPIECRISAHSQWLPRGYVRPDEAVLGTFGPKVMARPELWDTLRSWWLASEKRANTPNWDIAVSCEIEGVAGLVLVEAKANLPELGHAGKTLDSKPSAASEANHHRIGVAIQEACTALRDCDRGVAISRDSHYQLSNRIAFTWKLASLGVPTVLVYLGFCGDNGIADVGAPFKDDTHWRTCFAEYARPVAPMTLFEHRIDCGSAPAWFLVRSRAVLEESDASSEL